MPHTTFIASSEEEQQQMLKSIGAESFDDLFSGIPKELQADSIDLPSGLSEQETLQHLRGLAAQNAGHLVNFCGAGFYDHYIPAAVDTLSSRGEFFTAYTPYQPEASQGTLQAIYEFQTAITRLTDMEAANASLYDGGTALFEGLMMALRCTRRNKVLVDQGVNAIYRKMLRCYTRNLQIEYKEIELHDGRAGREAFEAQLDDQTGAVLLQNPNFFGFIDDLTDLCNKAHKVGALVVCSVYPVSLGILKTPGEMGVDIATGEGQSLGLPLLFGGPYLGFMATRKKYVRKMPGRICGLTTDQQGRRGFVLTLQAREQHIRRDKATSNICTNQALCALRATIYLSLMGKTGFARLAQLCADRASYAFERLTAIPGVEPLYKHYFFNEFALKLNRKAAEVSSALIDQGFAAGFPVYRYYEGMEDVLLLAFTEKRTKEEIDILAAKIEHVLGKA